MRQTTALHARGADSQEFEDQLAACISAIEDDGYYIVNISHAASITTGSDDIAEVVYSAVVVGIREAKR